MIAPGDGPPPEPRIEALVLAAGGSSRMEGRFKLLEPLDGRPLVTHAVQAALDSRASRVTVVVGAQAGDVVAVLPDAVHVVRNPRWNEGLASSLVMGTGTCTGDGVLVLLGDTPFVRWIDCDAVLDAYRPERIAVATVDGRRGHPVLWPRSFFDEIAELEGDRGAREIMDRHPEQVDEVPVGNPRLLLDVDTPEDLERARKGD